MNVLTIPKIDTNLKMKCN